MHLEGKISAGGADPARESNLDPLPDCNGSKVADFDLLPCDFTFIPAWNEINLFDYETKTTGIASLLTEFISFLPGNDSFLPGNDSFLSGNDHCSPEMDHFCPTFYRW